jgi:hypothetical protein
MCGFNVVGGLFIINGLFFMVALFLEPVVLYLFRQLVSDPFFEKIRGEITLIHS